mmetsp:Transcript_75535/g.208395  ORF Transcript_75535/g.208395 Transcript_75535/m.208395 type:complete len:1076 (+) Transcript_75535:238-3465(+)
MSGYGQQGKGMGGYGTQGKGKDGYGPHGKGKDGYGPQGKGADGHGPHGKGKDYYGAPGKGADGYAPQGKGMDGHSPQGKGTKAQGKGAGKAGTAKDSPPDTLIVSGCQHATIGEIVRGLFALQGENHERPTFKKNVQVNDLDVMLYFWDERDGTAFCGWWFGPKIGGDQVWAFHPSRDKVPPANGWRVPFNGPSDPTMVVKASTTPSVGGGAAPRPQAPPSPAKPAQARFVPALRPPTAQGAAAGPAQPHEWQISPVEPSPVALPPQRGGSQPVPAQSRFVMAPKVAGFQGASAAEQEAQRKKQQEEKKKQQEENKRKVEENKRLLEQRRQEEEKNEEKRKKEIQERKQKELKAANEIRKVQQKVRTATAGNFEELRLELEAVLEAELPNTGEKRQQTLEDSERILDQARAKVDAVLQKRREAEEKQKQEERQRREREERAEGLLQELGGLVEAAEAGLERAARAAAALADETEPTEARLEELAAATRSEAGEAKGLAEACTVFLKENRAELRAAPAPKPDRQQKSDDPFDKQPTEPRQLLAQLLQRVNACKRGADAAEARAAEARGAAQARAEALAQTRELQALFRKYDKDADEMLSRREVLAYAKGEFDFGLTDAALDLIWDSHSEYSAKHGDRGVQFGTFQLVKIAVGVERELQRDQVRRVQRQAMEKRLEEIKAEMQDRIKRATEAVAEADQAISRVEESVKPASTKGKAMLASEMVVLADQIEELIGAAKDSVGTAKDKMEGLKADIEDGFKDAVLAFIESETKKHNSLLGRMEGRIKRTAHLLGQFREEARKKKIDDIDKVRAASLRLARHHQQVGDLSSEEVFLQMDVGGDGVIDKDDFLAYFEAADKVIRPLNVGETAEEEEEEDRPVETVRLPAEELTDAFPGLCEKGEEGLSRERLAKLLTLYMVVVKETAMTDGPHIKVSKALRRLEVDEIVEVTHGLVRDQKAGGVLRARVRATKDGAEGWVSTVGNAGTVLLREIGRFRVLKEGPLAEAPEPAEGEGTEEGDGPAIVRKLKTGEELAVEEWPTQESAAGVQHMRVHAESDGATGWVALTDGHGGALLKALTV